MWKAKSVKIKLFKLISLKRLFRQKKGPILEIFSKRSAIRQRVDKADRLGSTVIPLDNSVISPAF